MGYLVEYLWARGISLSCSFPESERSYVFELRKGEESTVVTFSADSIRDEASFSNCVYWKIKEEADKLEARYAENEG